MDRDISGIQKHQKIRKLIIIIFSILLLLLILRFYVISVINFARVNRNDIEIAKVYQGNLEGSFTTEGTITPVKMYQVEATLGGKIEKIKKNTGDRIHAGETLLVLSNDDLQLSLITQETAVTEQENNLNNAKIVRNQNKLSNKRLIAEARNNLSKTSRDVKSQQSLYKKGYIPTDDYNQILDDNKLAETNYECLLEEAKSDSLFREQQISQLQQSLTQIRRSMDQVRSRINGLVIKAPIDGVITEMDLVPGQMVAMGSKIAVIEDTDHYFVQAKVDQYYLPQLNLNCKARIQLDNREIWLTISKIQPKLSNQNILVDLVGTLSADIKSGQTVTVDIIANTIPNVLILPQGQYLIDSASKWVFVIKPGGHKVEKRQVTFGSRNMKEIQVTSGLKEGEEVIVSSYRDWLNKQALIIKK